MSQEMELREDQASGCPQKVRSAARTGHTVLLLGDTFDQWCSYKKGETHEFPLGCIPHCILDLLDMARAKVKKEAGEFVFTATGMSYLNNRRKERAWARRYYEGRRTFQRNQDDMANDLCDAFSKLAIAIDFCNVHVAMAKTKFALSEAYESLIQAMIARIDACFEGV